MECESVQARLPELVDGELEEPVRQEVERHIDGCDDCRRARLVAEAIPRLLANPIHPDPPPTLVADVTRRVRRSRRGSRGRNAILALAAAALAGSGAAVAWDGGGGLPSPLTGQVAAVPDPPLSTPAAIRASTGTPAAPSRPALAGQTPGQPGSGPTDSPVPPTPPGPSSTPGCRSSKACATASPRPIGAASITAAPVTAVPIALPPASPTPTPDPDATDTPSPTPDPTITDTPSPVPGP